MSWVKVKKKEEEIVRTTIKELFSIQQTMFDTNIAGKVQ